MDACGKRDPRDYQTLLFQNVIHVDPFFATPTVDRDVNVFVTSESEKAFKKTFAKSRVSEFCLGPAQTLSSQGDERTGR